MTVVEVTVAMFIFSLCMAVFISALLQMTRTTVRAQNVVDNADQLRKGVTRLESEVRYAEAVNAPGVVGQSWFLEFRTLGFDGAASSCTQWRYSVAQGVLEERTWDDTQAPVDQWTPVASRLSRDPAVLTTAARFPFKLTPATSTRERQSVTVLLESPRDGTRTGAGAGPTGEQLRTVLTAVNSSASSKSNELLASGQSKSPVCSPSTSRTE
ncbi:PulJ/GspJ family protein [Kineococcus sp. SYSU DK002]|uniref:PulJ/GspJ family protein n=1 Tax=Kineococcus sp. SYSU DK002 TaxID=3383123 RepID=UPI003D7E1A8A